MTPEKQVDNTQEQRIEREALEKYPHEAYYQHIEGYIAGATEEAERAKALVVALENLRSFFPTGSQYHDIITNALQDYKK